MKDGMLTLNDWKFMKKGIPQMNLINKEIENRETDRRTGSKRDITNRENKEKQKQTEKDKVCKKR